MGEITQTRRPSSAGPYLNLDMESEFVRACLQKPGFAQRVLQRVPSDIFTNDQHSWIVEQIRNLMYKNRGKLARVPIEVLKHQAYSAFSQDQDKRDLMVRAIDTLYSKPVEYEAYAEGAIREYASYQTLTAGVRQALDSRFAKPTVGKVLEAIDEAKRKAQAIVTDVQTYDYVGNWREREQARAFKSEIPANNIRVKFGIPKMDEQVYLTPGTVHGFIAPFKRYKSIILNHMGIAAFLQSLNVLHVTLENSVELTSDRYDANIARIDFRKLIEQARTPEEAEHIERIFSRMEKWPQRVKIIAAPANDTTIENIQAEIDHLELNEGFCPEVVVLDYGNLFKASVSASDGQERKDQTQIVWDMQEMAKRRRTQRILITAFQSNMAGVKAERLQSDQIGKSIGIAQALEGAIAIDQNPQEKELGIVTLSPLFLRYGAVIHDHVTLGSDFSKMSIDRDAHTALWNEVHEWEGVDA